MIDSRAGAASVQIGPGALQARHTLWGVPDGGCRQSESSSLNDESSRPSQSSSSRPSNSSTGGCEEGDVPLGELAHLNGISNDPRDHSRGSLVKRSKETVSRPGRACKKSLKTKSSQNITAELHKFGLKLDEVQIKSESGSESDREDVECAENDALQLVCAIKTLQHFVGRYEIATRCANGRPVWQRDGGSYWLYAGTDGKWYIADRQVSDCSFYCSFGFVRSTSADGFSVPKDTTQWEWWDGSEWHPEGTIKLQAAPEVRGVQPASEINAHTKADASFDVPNEGSRGHHLGVCKPCAWYFSPGCENGAVCTFCHLCPKGEIQKRRDARKKRIRDSKEAKRQRERAEAEAGDGKTRMWL